jgi:hypothetical protein
VRVHNLNLNLSAPGAGPIGNAAAKCTACVGRTLLPLICPRIAGRAFAPLQSKRLLIESRWMSTSLEFAGKCRSRRLNNWLFGLTVFLSSMRSFVEPVMNADDERCYRHPATQRHAATTPIHSQSLIQVVGTCLRSIFCAVIPPLVMGPAATAAPLSVRAVSAAASGAAAPTAASARALRRALRRTFHVGRESACVARHAAKQRTVRRKISQQAQRQRYLRPQPRRRRSTR